jgi:hypothetical protein
MKISLFNLLIILIVFISPVYAQNNAALDWKAGVSKANITPKMQMPMAGFASRTHSSEGTLHSIWAKALALQDSNGNKAVMISSDLLGFPKDVSDRIRDRIKSNYGLDRSQILLNSSHTHSGPVIGNALTDIYILDNQQIEQIKEYTKIL